MQTLKKKAFCITMALICIFKFNTCIVRVIICHSWIFWPGKHEFRPYIFEILPKDNADIEENSIMVALICIFRLNTCIVRVSLYHNWNPWPWKHRIRHFILKSPLSNNADIEENRFLHNGGPNLHNFINCPKLSTGKPIWFERKTYGDIKSVNKPLLGKICRFPKWQLD